ncbi:hypothetical protein M3G91_28940 [Micromonospora chalcea]|nr:hypothetical protein [Micromonospora chalcea]
MPLGYQGGWTDPDTTQTNAHARWYNPATGAFSSRDTWTLAPSSPSVVNRYMYGGGDPVNRTDVSGHCPDGDPIYCFIEGVGTLGELIYEFWEGDPAGDPCYGRNGARPDAPAWCRGNAGASISLPSLHYCEKNRNSSSCRSYYESVPYVPGFGTRPSAGGSGPCSRSCTSPPAAPPCVTASRAAGLSGGELCRTPWLVNVDDRPAPGGSARPGAESMLPRGTQIGNDSSSGRSPVVRGDDMQESAPNGSGSSGLPPQAGWPEESIPTDFSPNVVYRAIRTDEDPSVGLRAKGDGDVPPWQHILAAPEDSPWISTTRDPKVAFGKYGRDAKKSRGVVRIDLTKIDSRYVDAANGLYVPDGYQWLEIGETAHRDRELLIHGYIPPEAITGYWPAS